jgi:hypothetical protein
MEKCKTTTTTKEIKQPDQTRHQTRADQTRPDPIKFENIFYPLL